MSDGDAAEFAALLNRGRTAATASSRDLSGFLTRTAEAADFLGPVVADAGFDIALEKNIAHAKPKLSSRKTLMSPKMHPDEIDIDSSLVRRLLARQFPRWAHLPIAKVQSAGTDNAIYRLGDDLAVRLPRLPRVAGTLVNELHWLPRLAPQLPLAIPAPVGSGAPDDAFPYQWAVYRWLPGDNLADQPDVDLPDTAVRLGRFVAALKRIDTTNGPPSFRGGPISTLDTRVRTEIQDVGADGILDPHLATAAWETALAAPAWHGPPVWTHADLYPTNLLAQHGRLTAVIDFGGVGTGDPAVDMLPAWALLTTQTRQLFRAEADVDDATWVRGRGWALALGIGAVHFYHATNPVLAANGKRCITEALADHQRSA